MCYTPVSYAKPEDLALKAQLFKDREGTVSQDPRTVRPPSTSLLTMFTIDALATCKHLCPA